MPALKDKLKELVGKIRKQAEVSPDAMERIKKNAEAMSKAAAEIKR